MPKLLQPSSIITTLRACSMFSFSLYPIAYEHLRHAISSHNMMRIFSVFSFDQSCQTISIMNQENNRFPSERCHRTAHYGYCGEILDGETAISFPLPTGGGKAYSCFVSRDLPPFFFASLGDGFSMINTTYIHWDRFTHTGRLLAGWGHSSGTNTHMWSLVTHSSHV